MQAWLSTREQNKLSLTAEVLHSFGQLHLQVTGTSMLPALWPRDVLTVHSAAFESVYPGDLVLYSRGDRFFVHRLIRKKTQAGKAVLITRGDAVPDADLPTGSEDLMGRVAEIRRAGCILTPCKRWWRLQRLAGLALCRFDPLRGSMLRLAERRLRLDAADLDLRTTATAPD
jgi:signal peptidase I